MSDQEEGQESNYEEIIKSYFKQHPSFFQNEEAKAIFLEGVLVGFLLETQRIINPQKTGNEAFWSSLHELRMDKRILLDLFPKTINKLKQLGKSYATFVKEVSQYFQNLGNEWDLSNIEMSWYFSNGLVSYQNFKKK